MLLFPETNQTMTKYFVLKERKQAAIYQQIPVLFAYRGSVTGSNRKRKANNKTVIR